jgi:hypothetical protein
MDMSEPDRDWETPFGTPQSVANPGGILQPDTEQSTGDDRLDQLPDFENDELRGASEEGAGVLSQGGTARETGQASGMDRPSGEDLETAAVGGRVLPLPIVGSEERNSTMG